MILRFALISLVLAIWLAMPESTQQLELRDSTELITTKPSAVIETKPHLSGATLEQRRAAKKKRRKEKRQRKEKKRKKRKERRRKKGKDKRRKHRRRRKDKKNFKKRKDKLRKKARRLRRKKKRSKKNKKKKYKKRLRKLMKMKNKRQSRRRKDRGERRRGLARIRRGRRRRKQSCKVDDDCKPGQCCKGNVCAEPGNGLKCFGPCMCKGREKTKNFICVTKKRVLRKYIEKHGNDTTRPFRGRCRNITLTELNDRNSKFVEVKAAKLELNLRKPLP